MNTQLIRTDDGSHTLFVPSLNEHYHSTFGAIRESTHIFINAGFHAAKVQGTPLNIFEAGFGTGLNAFLTLREAENSVIPVHYTTIEAFPLEEAVTRSLNYPDLLGENGPSSFRDIHNAAWEKEIRISDHFTLLKIHDKLENHLLPHESYHLVYFDAFGPDVQPELWTETIFTKLYQALKPGGILVTYSVKGSVKRALRSAGFLVEKLPGPPGKREITRASKK